MRTRSSRALIAAACSLVISLLLATQVLAVTWESPKRIASSPSSAGSRAIVGTGPSSAVVAVTQGDAAASRILVRRTTDSGGTWTPPVDVSTGGPGTARAGAASLASWGSTVDLVFLYGGSSEYDCSDGGCRVAYRRSTDGGAHWSAVRLLTSAATSPSGPDSPRVARRGNQVIVSWSLVQNGAIRVRTSIDGGVTFRSAITVATSTNAPYQSPQRNGYANVAIGGSMTYLVYAPSDGRVALRRSGDGGVHWQPATPLASDASTVSDLTVAATGAKVLVGWVAFDYGKAVDDSWSVYRRSFNSGVTWSGVGQLSPRSGPRSWDVTIDYRAGKWIATFYRCLVMECTSTTPRVVYLRQSADGATWGPTVRVSQSGVVSAFPGGATFAGKLLVAYTVYADHTSLPAAWVRAGTP
jgi:hypothetical protein